MAEEKTNGNSETETPDQTRRGLVKTAAKAAVVAPAVFVLLNASTKPASAQPVYIATGEGPILR